MGLKKGINHTAQPKMLKVWNLVMVFSSSRSSATSAHPAWVTIKMMAIMPEMPWTSRLGPPRYSKRHGGA